MLARVTARDLSAWGVLAIVVAGVCLVPSSETDLFFRLKVGQEIWARKALLGRNLFSFTAPDYPDLDASWAFEVALAGLYAAGGFTAVIVAKTAWLIAVFSGAYVLCRRRGVDVAVSLIVVAVGVFVVRERLVERPHIVSFAGDVFILFVAARLRRPGNVRLALGFAAAIAAWANAHAGVFIASVWLFLGGIGWMLSPAVETHRSEGDSPTALARRWWLFAAIAGCAVFLTPLGSGIVRYWWLHFEIPKWHTVDEFRTATWRSDASFFLWIALPILLGVAALALVRAASSTPPGAAPRTLGQTLRLALPDLLPAAGACLLGLLSVRFSADAVLFTMPLVASLVNRVLPRLKGVLVVAAGLLLAATLGPRVVAWRVGRPFVDATLDTEFLPLDAIRFVERNGLRERMYNDFEVGSYLAFEGFPRFRVFVDPRLPAYPEDLHRLLGAFDFDPKAWTAAMSRYRVESALLAYAGLNRRVAWWDPEEWALVYRESNARVFVRRLAKWKTLIAALEIPATFSFTVEEGVRTSPLTERPALSPVVDCEWQRRVGDLALELDGGESRRAEEAYRRALQPAGCLVPAHEARLSAWMGSLDVVGNHFESALAPLSRALALTPNDLVARANFANALMHVGRLTEATAEWQRVFREAPVGVLKETARQRLERLSPARE